MAKLQGQTLAFAPDAGIAFSRGTGTDTSQAITLHKRRGKITSSTTNLGADTSQDITLTNRLIKSNSMLVCQVDGGGSGVPVISKVTVSTGSAVIKVRNVHASQACTAAYTIEFLVIGDSSQVT